MNNEVDGKMTPIHKREAKQTPRNPYAKRASAARLASFVSTSTSNAAAQRIEFYTGRDYGFEQEVHGSSLGESTDTTPATLRRPDSYGHALFAMTTAAGHNGSETLDNTTTRVSNHSIIKKESLESKGNSTDMAPAMLTGADSDGRRPLPALPVAYDSTPKDTKTRAPIHVNIKQESPGRETHTPHGVGTGTIKTMPPQTHHAHHHQEEVIPHFVDSFERFFCIMLRSSVQDYIEANKSNAKSMQLWKMLCHRANLPVPSERIQPMYQNAKQHFDIRAALVLEEAREAISRGLASIQQKRETLQSALMRVDVKEQKQQLHPIPTMDLVLLEDAKSKPRGIFFLTFQKAPADDGKSRYFSAEEKQHLLPGQVMECSDEFGTSTLLGCVLPCSKERIHKMAQFDLLLFEQPPKSRSWRMTPVDAFIGTCRQFAACTEGAPESMLLIDAVLGNQQSPPATLAASHKEQAGTSPSSSSTENKTVNADPALSEPTFQVPPLNENQEKAVSTFLDSPLKSISVVQGPPGTGKTSLLVATICRYLSSSNTPRGRLLVCAPTNKAVSVLANRFLTAATDSYGCTVNVILVGDDDKLLEGKKHSPLRPHYVYSWKEKVLQEFGAIKSFLDPEKENRRNLSREDIVRKAIGVRRRILRSLLDLPPKVREKIGELCDGLSQGKLDTSSLFRLANEAHEAIDKLPYEAVEHDIMRSADVMFCTLCSSASRVMRDHVTSPIEALIVDEAAASTEPDLYIPFYLGPSRLLIVGDPKQLPSTVLSDRAKQFGLDVSLQERLMNHCNYDYTMLNVQYRMHPEISTFPSRHFYKGKICDGANVQSPVYGGCAQLLDGRRYVFLQVDGIETKGLTESRCNHMEANVIVDLVKQLVDSRDESWCSTDRLRIITFYTAQVALLRKKLENSGLANVLVATVDSSQGCEADLVIVSLVRSNSAGFLTDDRRVNVALTRARHQLVCVGNVSRYPSMVAARTLHHLASDARARSAIADACAFRPSKKMKTHALELP